MPNSADNTPQLSAHSSHDKDTQNPAAQYPQATDSLAAADKNAREYKETCS